MIRLNFRQEKVLEFVNEFHASRKYPAVMMDIVRKFGYSYNSARYVVLKLAELGYVDYIVENGKNRAIIPLWKK